MSRSSPGRYGLHEFSKNVYRVTAVNGQMQPLRVDRTDPYGWSVADHDGTVIVTYTLFGDTVSGTHTRIDKDVVHLNGPATFMWARGLESRPIRITLDMPHDQATVATQLAPTPAKNVFQADNLHDLMDSPIEISTLSTREWTDGPANGQATFRLAVHHAGTDRDVDIFAKLLKACVTEQRSVFDEFPKFDRGSYCFIVNVVPGIANDAMEHRNSTTLCEPKPLDQSAMSLLLTASHEFFHVWNVERLRPKSLEPFDLEQVNPCRELWFAEGITNYYDGLVLHRAGLWNLDRYARDLSETVNRFTNSPARGLASAVEMSVQAPLVDRTIWVDRWNVRNTHLSYYLYGDAIGLALDLTLRSRTKVTLDDYMRALWAHFGRQEISFDNDGLQATLAELVSPEFADDFFHRYVHGTEMADYPALLREFGFLVRPAHPEKASWGEAKVSERNGEVRLEEEPLAGRPLYRAGISRDDRIVSLDDEPVSKASQLDEIIARHHPGETLRLEYLQRGAVRREAVVLEADRTLEVVPVEHTGSALTESQFKLREAWLGSKSAVRVAGVRKECPHCLRAFGIEAEYCPFDGEKLRLAEITRPRSDDARESQGPRPAPSEAFREAP